MRWGWSQFTGTFTVKGGMSTVLPEHSGWLPWNCCGLTWASRLHQRYGLGGRRQRNPSPEQILHEWHLCNHFCAVIVWHNGCSDQAENSLLEAEGN